MLKVSVDKFQKIFEAIPDLYFLVDETGKHLDFKGNQELLYLTPDMFLGKTIEQTLPEHVSKIFFKAIKNTLETKEPTLVEYSLPINDFVHHYEARNLYFSENRVAIFVRDITKRKKLEQELLDEKKFTEAIINAQRDTLFVFEPSTGKAIRWNKAFAEISGYNNKEIANMRAPDSYYSKIELEKATRAIKEVNSEGTSLVEMDLITKDEKSIPFEYLGTSINDEEGNLKYIVSIGRDITERKKIEQKLKDSEEKYRNLFEKSPLGIFLFDENGNLLEGNTSGSNSLSGFPSSVSYNKNFIEIISLFKNSKELLQIFKKRAEDRKQGKELKPVEIEIIRQDGEKRWLYWQSSTVQLKDRILIQAIVQDITESKRAEIKLRESEEKIKNERDNLISMLTSMEDGVYIVNEYYEIEFVNPSLRNEFGSIGNKKCYEYFQDLSEPCQWCKTQEKVEQGSIRWELESPITKKLYEIITTPIKKSDNSVSKLVIFHDITDRKKAEQNLIESEDKFRTIAEQSLVGISIIQDNQVKYMNQHILDLFGYTKEEVESWNPGDFLRVAHPDFKERAIQNTMRNQSGEGKIPTHEEIKVVNKSGEAFWVEMFARSIPFNGKPAGMNMSIDITERKKAEQKLIESEDKFRTIAEQAVVGISIIQDNDIKYVNQRLLDYFGYNKEEVGKWPPGYFINVIHPDFRELILEITRKNQSDDAEEPSHIEIKTVKKNGEIQWTEVYLRSIIFNEKPAVMNVIVDITERKKATDKIKRARERADMYLNLAGVILVALNRDGDITLMNKKGYEILKYEEGELDGQNWVEKCIPYRYKEQVYNVFKQLMNGEIEPVEFFENPVITKDGREKIIAWHNIILYDQNGNIAGTLSSGEDITEHKKAKQELKRLSKLKSELLTRTSHELKTPAMHIKGYADLLLHKYKENLGIDELQIISHIKKGVLRLETLIYDIMHKAELDSGEGELYKVKSN
ncbi:MAG: PAS domain S-box protein, partial [Candidatus Hermodarchaeota archaeon]